MASPLIPPLASPALRFLLSHAPWSSPNSWIYLAPPWPLHNPVLSWTEELLSHKELYSLQLLMNKMAPFCPKPVS